MNNKQKIEIIGTLRMNPAGFGFVQREDGLDDVFIGSRHRELALDGDRVAISTWVGDKGTEGKIERVVEHRRKQLVGIARRARGGKLELQADDPRISATTQTINLRGDAPLGKVVVAKITRYPQTDGGPMEAELTRVLGEPEDLLVEIEKCIVLAEVPDEFPPAVVEAGDRSPTTVRPEDLADREDLRHLEFLTIDPETARDFDDACAIMPSPRGEGWDQLWVAVADVSHYVRPGTVIDNEARERGVSVYLPNRAIPMLPEPLSSGICSLNPDVDRLAMVARVEVGPDGRTTDHHFCAAVIRSRARLDYPGVGASLAGDTRGAREKYIPWLPKLEKMRGIAKRLRSLRDLRGALDFDLPEAKVILDDDDPRRVRDVVKSRGDDAIKGAYQMIEDFMLAANEAVALRFTTRKEDAVWRIHAPPSTERLAQLAAVVESYGLAFDAEAGKDPRKLRDFLDTLKGKPAEASLQMMLLRALKQAAYDVVNVGHFGLAARDYVHFTSPIRRYPDLLIHRLLKQSITTDGGMAGGAPPPEMTPEQLAEMAVKSSAFERRAMGVEREVVDLYRCVLVRDKVGETFDAKVVGVTSFGLFVSIESPYIEGLIKLQSLQGDFYEFDSERMKLVGKKTGKSFSLGAPMRVTIDNVSVSRRQIDLSPAAVQPEQPRSADDDMSYDAVKTPRVPTRRKRPDTVRGKIGISGGGKLGIAGGGKGRVRLKVSGHSTSSSKTVPEWVKDKTTGGKKPPERKRRKRP